MKNAWKLVPLMLLATTLVAIPVVAQEGEKAFSIVSLVLDIVMIAIGLVSVYYAWSVLQGKIGQGLKIAAIGLAILGFFHFLATVLPSLTNIPLDMNQMVHRILGVIAFSFIAFGLYKIKLAIKMVSVK